MTRPIEVVQGGMQLPTEGQLATMRMVITWVRIRSGGDHGEMLGLLVGALSAVAVETGDAPTVLAAIAEMVAEAARIIGGRDRAPDLAAVRTGTPS